VASLVLTQFSPALLIGLAGACAGMLVLEGHGARTTLALKFKGDVKRESRWLAQYGQGVCTVVAALLMWQLDPARRGLVVPLLTATFGVSLLAALLKRVFSRVRPGRESAGKFLGPTWKHNNAVESFPSSHSASAVAMSTMLAIFYPQAAITFWTLALGCATLRYLLDAHWPSDVLGGIALGYGAAHLTAWAMKVV
jgi:membrane-associated phospholipid phosphatase